MYKGLISKGEIRNMPVGSRLNRNVRRFYKRYANKVKRREGRNVCTSST